LNHQREDRRDGPVFFQNYKIQERLDAGSGNARGILVIPSHPGAAFMGGCHD